MKQNKYTHIIWDWNGTLVDDVQYAVNIMNKMLIKRNLPVLKNIKEYYDIFCFPVFKYYEKLGFDFRQETFADLAAEFTQSYNQSCNELNLRENAEKVLQEIAERNIKQIILSATQSENLLLQMSKFNINHYFDKIIGLSNIFAASKVDVAKQYLGKENFANSIIVGDTLHDLQVAEALGLKCILISGGHASKESLFLHNNAVIDNVEEVLKYID